ncbi:uncharacterized protein LOC134466044 [Engraulis encrasicolus]|uniref:uncharacterized protein LOC134466044 n=1 Tax=Engraulis encrasicolus TaxID=184585 RepID=UPI002FD42F2A
MDEHRKSFTNALSPSYVLPSRRTISQKCRDLCDMAIVEHVRVGYLYDPANIQPLPPLGNRKMFPLGVQFFTPSAGIVNKVIDFVETADETADGIAKMLLSCLQNLGLSPEQISAFSADNANVNYGRHNSVFTKLREANDGILRDGYLNPAITRLLQNWVPLKSYLVSIGDECPRHLQRLLRLTEDAAEVEESDTVEVYLLFCNNVMSLFEEVVKKLERNLTTAVDLYAIMESFLRGLKQRRDDEFYGYLTKRRLQRLIPSDADVARQEFKAFLNHAIDYLEKWFDYSDKNWLFNLQPLSLTSGKISFDDLEKIIEQLRLVGRLNLCMDNVYEECVTANGLLAHLTAPQEDWQSKQTAERWMQLLQAAALPNLQAVASFLLSIPSSTGFVERIFSLMNAKWSDVRNRCSTALIKAELIVSLNYGMPCSEFYSAALNNKRLLAAARSQKKYKWKQ